MGAFTAVVYTKCRWAARSPRRPRREVYLRVSDALRGPAASNHGPLVCVGTPDPAQRGESSGGRLGLLEFLERLSADFDRPLAFNPRIWRVRLCIGGVGRLAVAGETRPGSWCSVSHCVLAGACFSVSRGIRMSRVLLSNSWAVVRPTVPLLVVAGVASAMRPSLALLSRRPALRLVIVRFRAAAAAVSAVLYLSTCLITASAFQYCCATMICAVSSLVLAVAALRLRTGEAGAGRVS
jgi:hypothetical protein